MGSIFWACFLLPHGYGGTQMGTKNGSRFGSQFLLRFLRFFWIWGAAFSDNFAAFHLLAYGFVLFFYSTGFTISASIPAGPMFASNLD